MGEPTEGSGPQSAPSAPPSDAASPGAASASLRASNGGGPPSFVVVPPSPPSVIGRLSGWSPSITLSAGRWSAVASLLRSRVRGRVAPVPPPSPGPLPDGWIPASRSHPAADSRAASATEARCATRRYHAARRPRALPNGHHSIPGPGRASAATGRLTSSAAFLTRFPPGRPEHPPLAQLPRLRHQLPWTSPSSAPTFPPGGGGNRRDRTGSRPLPSSPPPLRRRRR